MADRIIEPLVAVGVKYIYGIPRDLNLSLREAFSSKKPTIVDVIIDLI
ncbi:MAG: hypothetical protein H3Z52_10370 [archaeon]|nr:hypothetical protein [archaeon]